MAVHSRHLRYTQTHHYKVCIWRELLNRLSALGLLLTTTKMLDLVFIIDYTNTVADPFENLFRFDDNTLYFDRTKRSYYKRRIISVHFKSIINFDARASPIRTSFKRHGWYTSKVLSSSKVFMSSNNALLKNLAANQTRHTTTATWYHLGPVYKYIAWNAAVYLGWQRQRR